MNVAVLQFPGSGSDHDTVAAFRDGLGLSARLVWHKEADPGPFDLIVLPGGFSFGDYLRPGAIAVHSPVLGAVREHAAKGGPVLGIGNGFQILCEAGLLPGALIENRNLEFQCGTVSLAVEDSTETFNREVLGESVRLPVANGKGNFQIDEEGLGRLEGNNQVLLRYGVAASEVVSAARENGSVKNIAGIRNEAGNVFGLMPHPERAVERFHTSLDGLKVLKAILAGSPAGRS